MIRFKLCGPRPVEMRVAEAVAVDTGGGGYVEPYPGRTRRRQGDRTGSCNEKQTHGRGCDNLRNPYHETSNQSGG